MTPPGDEASRRADEGGGSVDATDGYFTLLGWRVCRVDLNP
ncbi:MAG TPA: hypothetical protein PKW35_24545 [Nannocystaceae bacterium]|nr:hypothetical protein [Nannocystaceae bacterium]